MSSRFYNKMALQFIGLLIAFLPAVSFAQTNHLVSGTVTDPAGDPLPGVTVMVDGTTRGVATDIDGKYSIEASQEDKLIFSFVGMETQEIIVGARIKIDVTMQEDKSLLEEVVVVGYGVQKKESVVGAISQVSGEKMSKVKMGGSIENSLQGNLPGLTVIMTDPTPGEEAMGGYYAASPIQMAIRGSSSMGGNQPLIIVDGVERPLSNIDPNEVASVSILKDASATAVYGVRGANGVIIVNTKRGQAGALELTFNSDLTMKVANMLPEYMGAYETLQLRNEAFKNDGLWDRVVSDDILEKYRTQEEPFLYPDFDWMDFYFKPGFDQRYNLNARGGNKFARYFVSVGYLNEGDIFDVGNIFPYEYDKKNAHYWHDRFNFRNNLDFNLTKSTTLAVNLGGNIKIWNKPEDTFTQMLWYEPVNQLPFYPAEALEQYPDPLIPYNQAGIRPFIRPGEGEVRLHWTGGRGFKRFKANELNADLQLNQALDFITKGLSFSAKYSYNSQVRYQKRFNLDRYFGYYLDPETKTWGRFNNWGEEDLDTPQPPLRVEGNENIFSALRSQFYQGQIGYGRSFGRHNVGGTGIFMRRESRGISNFPHYEENWIGRGTYNYDERYFLEASVAHSGSEKFAPGLRFGTFPSVAAGWMISNEDFYGPSIRNYISSLKIRYSYGVVGSDAGIARWLYISEFTRGGGSVGFGFPVQPYEFIREGNIPITDATWEEATKQNLGFELGFLENTITLNVDLFNERRTGMLQSRMSVPSYTGVSNIMGNIGETKSQGIEVDLGFNKAVSRDLFVYGSANVAMSENRVVYFDEPEVVPFNLKAEGKPVDIARRLDSYTPGTGILDVGFYQHFDELFMYPVASGSPIVGDLKFLDFNGDGNIDQQDRVVAENPITPHTTWNASLGTQYRSWSFDVSFYGISAVQFPMRQGGMFYLYPFTDNAVNAYTAHANRWTPTNRSPEFPAVHSLATNQYNYQISQFSMIDGQYIRLRNARLGYSLKGRLLDKLGITTMNVGLVGTNLFTWKKLGWGGDPEGFNFGVDFGAYPQMRRYTLDLTITF